jgi:glycosyltransferase involved in cell wall biosynthesis
MKLVHVTTVPMTFLFLGGQLGYMRNRGFELHGISSSGAQLEEGIPVHVVRMHRRITPLHDLVALFCIWKVLRHIRPQIVHSHTPKGGLLGMMAAGLFRVPVRVYHMRGLPFVTATGLKRVLLRWSEIISCTLSHQIICVSHSLRETAIAEGVCPAGKIKVLLSGSGNGVDAENRFNPARVGERNRHEVRVRLDIPQDALVIGFVGRVVRDKGVVELIQAWETLNKEFDSLHLLIVGPFESQDPVPLGVRGTLRHDPGIRLTGMVGDVSPLYSAMDVVALPTYREGFPNVPLEAAAMELPVVASRVVGCVDAVQDGMTGTLVPPHDSAALTDAIRLYLNDPDLRRRHGQAGRERVLREFRQEAIWEALYQEYVRLLRERGLPIPEITSDG